MAAAAAEAEAAAAAAGVEDELLPFAAGPPDTERGELAGLLWAEGGSAGVGSRVRR
jgi:hypothetical protein